MRKNQDLGIWKGNCSFEKWMGFVGIREEMNMESIWKTDVDWNKDIYNDK